MIEDKASATYKHENPIVRWYFNKKMDLVIKLAKLRKKDLILDFGCGEGQLKKRLKKYNVIGYDLNLRQTEIKDYRKLKPDKIIAMDVFEHIPKKKISGIIDNFKKMNPNFELIVALPTEGFLSRKARKLLGKRERALGHITPLKEILKIFRKKKLKLTKKTNFLNVSYLALFKNGS